jgi:hypothetical protein
MNKICSKCKQVKLFECFYKASKTKIGYADRCKPCDLEYQRNRKAEKAESNKRWYEKNGQKQNEIKRVKTKEKRLAYLEAKVLALENIEKWRRNQAKRALQKKIATPKWVDGQHHSRIGKIYEAAQKLQELTGSIYHVDHIVPLFSKDVCGLHVWWNLQPLPESYNLAKNNVFDPNLFLEQGTVAFPSNDGLTAAQFVVLKESEEDE